MPKCVILSNFQTMWSSLFGSINLAFKDHQKVVLNEQIFCRYSLALCSLLRNEEAEKYENDHQEQELDLHNISPTAVYFSAKHSPSCQKQVPKTNYLCQTLSRFPPSCFSMRNHLRSFKIHFFFNPFDKNMPKILMKIFQAIVFKIVKWKEIIWKKMFFK